MSLKNFDLREVSASRNKIPQNLQKHVTVVDSSDSDITPLALLKKDIVINRYEGSMENLKASSTVRKVVKEGKVFTFNSDEDKAAKVAEGGLSADTMAVMTGAKPNGNIHNTAAVDNTNGIAGITAPVLSIPEKSLEVTLKIVDSFGISTKCRDAFLSDDEKYVILIFKPGEFQIDLGDDPNISVVLLVESLPSIYQVSPLFVRFNRAGDEYCIYEILRAKALASN